MPVRNEEAHLHRVLDSVLNQTLPPETIVVVNDGSTDSTPDILREYQKTTGIVVLNKRTRVKDSSININIGIRIGLERLLVAPPPYILRVDGDSILFSFHAESCIDLLETNPKVGLTGGYGHTRRYNRSHQADASRMYRTEALLDVLEGNPYPVQFASDSWAFFAVQWKGWEVHPLPIPYIDLRPYRKTVYRSIMSGRWRKSLGVIFLDMLAKTRREVRSPNPYIVGGLAEFLSYLFSPRDDFKLPQGFVDWFKVWSRQRAVEFVHEIPERLGL